MLVIARITDKKLYSRYTWEYLRDATPEDEEAWDFRKGSSITVDIPTKVMKKNAPKAYQYSLKGILGHELISVDIGPPPVESEGKMKNIRCSGLSVHGNQCQNSAGKDGFCRRHRGNPIRGLPRVPDLHITCKACGSKVDSHKRLEKRLYSEKPTYYLCPKCVDNYNHQLPEGSIVVNHLDRIERFSAFTLRKATEEEAQAVLRAKALASYVFGPND